MPALKARQEYSPGQRSGNKMFPATPSPERAQHISYNLCADTCPWSMLFRPYRAVLLST